MPEDMTIPVFLYNRTFAGHELSSASILDLAPTAADVLGVPADREWEGKSLL
jgi:arylsulfatase A-like enzyme